MEELFSEVSSCLARESSSVKRSYVLPPKTHGRGSTRRMAAAWSTGWPMPTCYPRWCRPPEFLTYDWDANYFRDATVETLLGHGDTLLSLVAQRPGPNVATGPLIFVASCFGRLILAQVATWANWWGYHY